MNLVIAAPDSATLINIEDLSKFDLGNIYKIRAKPYPPSFNKIAANTIEPAIGASTWAFGNHKCTINIGSLTKNPAKVNSQNNELEDTTEGIKNSLLIHIFMWNEV